MQALTAKATPNAEIERARLDLQRLGQDADAEMAALNEALQQEFDAKLKPILKAILEEDHIGLIFETPHPSLIVWSDASINITAKVIQRLDAADRLK